MPPGLVSRLACRAACAEPAASSERASSWVTCNHTGPLRWICLSLNYAKEETSLGRNSSSVEWKVQAKWVTTAVVCSMCISAYQDACLRKCLSWVMQLVLSNKQPEVQLNHESMTRQCAQIRNSKCVESMPCS